MAKKKTFLEEVSDWEGAVVGDYDPYAHIVETFSPSLNFTYGKTWGLPLGYTTALYGKEKSGKTLISNLFIAHLHATDPDAIVVKYNTERRERLQFGPDVRKRWGVDSNRYMCFESNNPMVIFDSFEQKIPALIEKGFPVKLVVIDSLQGVQGRRAMNAKSIETQQVGDHALTIGEGFKRILEVQRKYNIAVLVVCQARSELNMAEQMRGKDVKMAAPYALRHYAEYFLYVEQNETKDGRKDIAGNELVNSNVADLSRDAKGDQTGHKIKVIMKASSAGPRGRTGEFTIDYNKGLINVHEEVFRLALARGVLIREGNTKYVFRDKVWTGGVPAVLKAIQDDLDLQRALVKEMKTLDLQGHFDSEDAKYTEDIWEGETAE